MISLSHPDLRVRDIRRLVSLASQKLVWEREPAASSEWIYFSFENEAHHSRSLGWLRSKQIPDDTEVLLDQDENSLMSTTWGEILAEAETLFSNKATKVIDKDLTWMLRFDPVAVVCFGRYAK